MALSVEIEKDLGSFHLQVCFEAEDGVLSLLGASGCGKSLTLRCIAGVERPDRGRILLNGDTWFDSSRGISLSPQERQAGLMFQNYALFPNMTVYQNIAAGARKEKNRASRQSIVAGAMEEFHLGQLADRYPDQLSGGQQQRVALARMLVSHPQVLMLDEPFSALDSHLRLQMEQEVRRTVRRFDGPVLLVSHDRDEVFRMSDRVAVMKEGTIERIGVPKEVFNRPATRNEALLTGCGNLSRVQRLGDGKVLALDWGVALSLPGVTEEISAIGIQMHHVRRGMGENCFQCRVVQEIENSFSYTITLCPLEGEHEGGSGMIHWELDKKEWNAIRAEYQEICLPAESILLLKE